MGAWWGRELFPGREIEGLSTEGLGLLDRQNDGVYYRFQAINLRLRMVLILDPANSLLRADGLPLGGTLTVPQHGGLATVHRPLCLSIFFFSPDRGVPGRMGRPGFSISHLCMVQGGPPRVAC